MDKPLLAYALWLSYSQEQRRKLVKLFSIPRTGEVIVHVGEMMAGNIGGSAKQDGHRPEDLYAVTVERVYELLNQKLPEKPEDRNFYQAFQEVIDNLPDIYQEHYPDEVLVENVHAVPLIAAGNDVAPAPEVASVKEEEFVPRDPEELIKPKTGNNEKAKTKKAKAK